MHHWDPDVQPSVMSGLRALVWEACCGSRQNPSSESSVPALVTWFQALGIWFYCLPLNIGHTLLHRTAIFIPISQIKV